MGVAVGVTDEDGEVDGLAVAPFLRPVIITTSKVAEEEVCVFTV